MSAKEIQYFHTLKNICTNAWNLNHYSSKIRFHTQFSYFGRFYRRFLQGDMNKKSSPLRESLSLVVLCNRREEKD